MKSLVQEASTIAKAIKQAWEIAGKPRDFSVKILEQPEYNFFGLTKRSAKIALLFEAEAGLKEGSRGKTSVDQSSKSPRFQQRAAVQSGRRGTSSESAYGVSQDAYQQQNSTPVRENRLQRENRSEARDRNEQRPREVRDHRGDARRQFVPRPLPTTPQVQQNMMGYQGNAQQMREEQQKRDEATKVESVSRSPKMLQEAQWSEELLTSARLWFKEVLILMGLGDVDFTFDVQENNLNIVFSRRLIDDEAREKHLFASLSTLLVSTLKRQYRRALRGHRVMLSHK